MILIIISMEHKQNETLWPDHTDRNLIISWSLGSCKTRKQSGFVDHINRKIIMAVKCQKTNGIGLRMEKPWWRKQNIPLIAQRHIKQEVADMENRFNHLSKFSLNNSLRSFITIWACQFRLRIKVAQDQSVASSMRKKGLITTPI